MDTTEAGAAMPWKKPLRVHRRIANHRKVEIPIKILITAAKKIRAKSSLLEVVKLCKWFWDASESEQYQPINIMGRDGPACVAQSLGILRLMSPPLTVGAIIESGSKWGHVETFLGPVAFYGWDHHLTTKRTILKGKPTKFTDQRMEQVHNARSLGTLWTGCHPP